MNKNEPARPLGAATGYAACWQCPLWRPNGNDTGWCRLVRIDFHAESPACGHMRYAIEASAINTERAHMYEFVRTLNASQFADIFRRNIAGEGQFDDLVKAAMVDRANRRHNDEAERTAGGAK